MKDKILAFGLALVIIINISALVTFAYHRWLRPEGKPAVPRAANSIASFRGPLCLSGEQERCIRDIRSDFDSETEHIQTEMRGKKRLLVQEMKQDPPDMARIDKLIDDISRLQAEIQKKAALNLLKEKEALTPEQRAIFFRMFEDHVCPRKKRPGYSSTESGDARCAQEIGR